MTKTWWDKHMDRTRRRVNFWIHVRYPRVAVSLNLSRSDLTVELAVEPLARVYAGLEWPWFDKAGAYLGPYLELSVLGCHASIDGQLFNDKKWWS